MKNIVLIGMMGSGKTTVGRLLADALGRELVDTDALIERREGRTISAMMAAEGESFFREWERRVSDELSQRQDLIISCGGGLPMADERMAPLKETGIVFWLERDPGATYDGLDISGRPLAQEGRDAFVERAARRFPLYRRWADHIISHPPTPPAAAECILAILKDKEAPT